MILAASGATRCGTEPGLQSTPTTPRASPDPGEEAARHAPGAPAPLYCRLPTRRAVHARRNHDPPRGLARHPGCSARRRGAGLRRHRDLGDRERSVHSAGIRSPGDAADRAWNRHRGLLPAQPHGRGEHLLGPPAELARPLRPRPRHPGEGPQRAAVQRAVGAAGSAAAGVRRVAAGNLALLGEAGTAALRGRALPLHAHDARVLPSAVGPAADSGPDRGRRAGHDEALGSGLRWRPASRLLHPALSRGGGHPQRGRGPRKSRAARGTRSRSGVGASSRPAPTRMPSAR